MSTIFGENDDGDNLRNDLAALRRDVAGLMEHLKVKATATANETLANATGVLNAPGTAAHKVCDSMCASRDALAKQTGELIDKRPLLVILATFALGYIGGRLLWR